jgi:hypothetical protein
MPNLIIEATHQLYFADAPGHPTTPEQGALYVLIRDVRDACLSALNEVTLTYSNGRRATELDSVGVTLRQKTELSSAPYAVTFWFHPPLAPADYSGNTGADYSLQTGYATLISELVWEHYQKHQRSVDVCDRYGIGWLLEVVPMSCAGFCVKPGGVRAARWPNPLDED